MIEVPIVMLGGYSRKFLQRQCKIQLYRDDLGEQKLLKQCILRLSYSPKTQNFGNMVLPPGYTGFITNLPFWATRRLERMWKILLNYHSKIGKATVCCIWSNSRSMRSNMGTYAESWKLFSQMRIIYLI